MPSPTLPHPDRPLILLSNREPYEHVHRAGRVEVRSPAGGLVSALDPILRRTHGTWVAWASGSADRTVADDFGRVSVPPDDPSYTLRRVWLSEEDVEGFYLGFANSALWPLCHLFVSMVDVRRSNWKSYVRANALFSAAVVQEAERVGGAPMVWVHDYHFALVPATIRRTIPDALIHQFWHIPFPPPDVFGILPLGVQDALLRGLLGNDLMEFQTDGYARNFVDCVSRVLPDSRFSASEACIEFKGRATRIGVFPISIDVVEWGRLATLRRTVEMSDTLRQRYAPGSRQLVVSVDRMDYTKGIVRRLRALEHMWRSQPERRGTFTMLVVATPSRTDIPVYARLEHDVLDQIARLNDEFRTLDWTPIVLVHDNVDADLLAAVYRAADVCVVSSLQDGMNLVAKEFIACRTTGAGVLVLSRFAGAADELSAALMVNPFFIDAFADTLGVALDMPAEERASRMEQLRNRISNATIEDWLDSILSAAEAAGRALEGDAAVL
ncbi:MAG: trehalose-6-phosphate synthase [Gemmatimonadaceae bacterium]